MRYKYSHTKTTITAIHCWWIQTYLRTWGTNTAILRLLSLPSIADGYSLDSSKKTGNKAGCSWALAELERETNVHLKKKYSNQEETQTRQWVLIQGLFKAWCSYHVSCYKSHQNLNHLLKRSLLHHFLCSVSFDYLRQSYVRLSEINILLWDLAWYHVIN